MADDSVLVGYAGMQTAADGFNAAASKLMSTLTDLSQQITTLLNNGTFVGSTADSFRANQQLLDQGLTQMHQVVAKLSSVISEATATYQNADRTAASLFQ
jgi:WXG100 family type VII secretion target